MKCGSNVPFSGDSIPFTDPPPGLRHVSLAIHRISVNSLGLGLFLHSAVYPTDRELGRAAVTAATAPLCGRLPVTGLRRPLAFLFRLLLFLLISLVTRTSESAYLV